MVTNFRDLIKALYISDMDDDCVSDEWANPEVDDIESEISVISASKTSGMNASSISGVPSFLEVLKVAKPAEVSRKRKTYCNTHGSHRSPTYIWFSTFHSKARTCKAP